jgi:exopolysaccharide production protein ExoZ
MIAVGKKDWNVQALRGLAAMLVVTLHAYNALDEHGFRVTIGTPYLADDFGAMGVDLFFVISGAMMALAIEREPHPAAFLLARFRRVVPMFWIAALTTTAIAWSLGKPPAPASLLNSATILPIFDHRVYHMPIPGVGWTLAFEGYFYLIVALALILPRAVRADAVAAILLAGAIIGWLLRPLSNPMLGIVCNPILLEFLLGFWSLRTARTPLVRCIGPWLAVLGGTALTLGALSGHPFASDPLSVFRCWSGLPRLLIWGMPAALLLIGVLGRKTGDTSPGPFVRLGDASYAIYLVHPALFLLPPLISPWHGPMASELLLAFSIGGAALAGLAVHAFVERPLLRRWRAQAASVTASASTVSPRSLTSAKPPSTRMRAVMLLGPE